MFKHFSSEFGHEFRCFKGGSSSVEYSQSPEQQQVFQALMPVINKLAMAGVQGGTTQAAMPSYQQSYQQPYNYLPRGGFPRGGDAWRPQPTTAQQLVQQTQQPYQQPYSPYAGISGATPFNYFPRGGNAVRPQPTTAQQLVQQTQQPTQQAQQLVQQTQQPTQQAQQQAGYSINEDKVTACGTSRSQAYWDRLRSGNIDNVQYQDALSKGMITPTPADASQGIAPSGQQPLWDIPPAPSAAGVATDVPMYDTPDVSSIQPTKQWWESLSPDVKAGAWQPYLEGAQQLAEMLGSYGQGSQMGGASGSMQAGLGQFFSDASQQVGQDLWKMSSPGAFTDYGAQAQQMMLPYQQAIQERQTDYGTSMNMWQQGQQQAALPFSILPGLMGGTYSNPVVDQGGGGMSLGGGISGATSGAMMGSAVPGLGTVLGGVLGGVGGLLGGK